MNATSTPGFSPQQPKSRGSVLEASAASETIISTGVATGGITGLLNPAAANKAMNGARLLRSVDCRYHEDEDDDELSDPSWQQLFLPIPVLGLSSKYDGTASAIVFSTLLILASGAASAVAVVVGMKEEKVPPKGSQGDKEHEEDAIKAQKKKSIINKNKWTAIRGINIFFAVTLSFYGPNVIGVAVTLAQHGDTAQARVMSVLSIGACIGLLVAAAVVILKVPRRLARSVEDRSRADYNMALREEETTKEPPQENGSSATAVDIHEGRDDVSALQVQLSTNFEALYDAGRVLTDFKIRLLIIEDILVAYCLAVTSGIRLSSASSCTILSIVQLLITLLHLAYQAVFRPFLVKLEQGFALAIAVIQVVVAIAALIATIQFSAAVSNDSNTSAPTLPAGTESALLYGTIVLNAMLYVQLVALAIYEVYFILLEKKKKSAQGETSLDHGPNDQVAGADDHNLAAPLLVIPSSSSGGGEGGGNGSDKGSGSSGGGGGKLLEERRSSSSSLQQQPQQRHDTPRMNPLQSPPQ